MAAVRAGACGLSRSPRLTLFATRASMRRVLSKAGSWSRGTEEPRPRQGKGYGVAASTPEAAHSVWTKRRRMLELKMKLCDWCVGFSIAGLIFAVADVELNANEEYAKKFSAISFVFRLLCIFLTVGLELALIAYHYTDTKIYLLETGTNHWRIAVSSDRVMRILGEFLICAVCPIPESGFVDWPLLSADPFRTRTRVTVPMNVLICLPMFLRIYLVCRYVVLHSKHYQDCATRTIASLNHISVDFRFVVRSQMYERPLHLMCVVTVCFWLISSWMITQCERFIYPDIAGYQHLFDYLWFEIITFFSIGYGDIQVQTYCGRGLAILTAIVGTLFSSTLIALVGRKMALTSSEKRVNHLIAENQLSRDHKHAAARVLQNTWRVVLRKRELDGRNSEKSLGLAASQRGLLRAVLTFRKTRWRLRMQMEDEDDYFTARRAFMETEERLMKVRYRQQQLNCKLTQLFDHVQLLTDMVHGEYKGSRASSIASNRLTVPNLAPTL